MANDNRTVEEIERDLERERARLGSTIEQLCDRMSVENVTREVTEQLKSLGSDAFRDTTDRLMANARANPAAVAIAGAGLLWMMLSTPKTLSNPVMPPMRPDRDDSPAPPNPRPPVSEDVQTPASEQVDEAGRDALASLRDGAADLRSRISEGTEELTAEGKARVIAAREAAFEAMDATVRGVKTKTRKFATSVEENPWVYGGIALAFGAAVGGALLYRKSELDAREERNKLFAEADRIFREEAERVILERNTAVAGTGPNQANGS